MDAYPSVARFRFFWSIAAHHHEAEYHRSEHKLQYLLLIISGDVIAVKVPVNQKEEVQQALTWNLWHFFGLLLRASTVVAVFATYAWDLKDLRMVKKAKNKHNNTKNPPQHHKLNHPTGPIKRWEGVLRLSWAGLWASDTIRVVIGSSCTSLFASLTAL